MAYFARKIRYAANIMGFIAFIEIAKKKGGKPVKYIAYRADFSESELYEMVEFNSLEDMEKYMPFGGLIEKWKKTTGWLYKVSAGGSYQEHKQGTWVKIRSPYFRKRKKKKCVLQFGNLRHILLVAKSKKKRIEKELSDRGLSPEKYYEREYPEYENLFENLRSAEHKITIIIGEIKFKTERAALVREAK